jgi:hypothetical protein
VSQEYEKKKMIVMASDNVTGELHDWHPTSNRIVDGTNDHNIIAPNSPWPDLPLFASLVGRTMVHFAHLEKITKAQYTHVSYFGSASTHLKKSIDGASDLMSQQSDTDGIVRARLIAGLDLSLELLVTGPLTPQDEFVNNSQRQEKNNTHGNTKVRRRLIAQLRGGVRIAEGIALASSGRLER